MATATIIHAAGGDIDAIAKLMSRCRKWLHCFLKNASAASRPKVAAVVAEGRTWASPETFGAGSIATFGSGSCELHQ